MREIKYTPGPWFVNEFDNNTDARPHHWVTAGEDSGCKGDRYMSVSGSIDINDAKLIASAPELLESLQLLMESYEKYGHLLNFDVSIAREAINKALNIQQS